MQLRQPTGTWRWPTLLAMMLVSGFAGLGYQIVWTQQSALWLGHESAAVLAVVTAFFAGLGLGAAILAKPIAASPNPLRWYAGCELLIGVWSALLTQFIGPFSGAMLHLTGANATPMRLWSVAFVGTFLLLLPATVAMGATLPALQKVAARIQSAGRSVALLYACNTFGAMAGVLAIAFWLAPAFGLTRTVAVCVACNALCAAGALMMSRTGHRDEVVDASAVEPRGQAPILWTLAATGLLGIGYEVLAVRVLSQVTEETVYTFALLLAVYLGGTAAGAAAYARWQRPAHLESDAATPLFGWLATACFVGISALFGAERLKQWMLQQLPAGAASAMTVEALLALFAFGPPTVLMGALFSQLSRRALERGVTLGRAMAANTLGAALSPLAFGVLALPALGPKVALLLIVVGYLALTPRRSWLTPAFALPALATGSALVLLPALAFVDIPAGGRVIHYQDGVMASVSVVEDAAGVRRLRIDNRQQEGSNSSLRVDSRQALLPLLLHPHPQRALFLGLGTGVTASAAAADPNVQVDAVELLPEVIAASHQFTSTLPAELNGARLRLVAADARRFVRIGADRYDVIVADNFHPARSGSGSLYTVEHFDAVRLRLNTHGFFVQWLPLHQLDLPTLRSIVQSFLRVFPDGYALLASNSLQTPVVGLLGRADEGRWDFAAVQSRVAGAAPASLIRSAGIEDAFALLGSFIADADALRRFAGAAPANTDDLPVVAYAAPRITYAEDSLPAERLLSLLQNLRVDPARIISNSNPMLRRRLAAYWAARDHFVESGRGVRPVPDAAEMLQQVREPLLAVLRISPDFRPAYDPLMMMAQSLGADDPVRARELLAQLAQLSPERLEAPEALRQLDSASR